MTHETNSFKVSVIIPAQNREQTLPEVLHAIREDPSVYEIIVVDDASTDSTVRISRELGAMTITLESNHGANYCRNLGASHASGDIFLFLDSDVVIRPEAIAELRRALSNGNVDAIVGLYSAHHRHPELASQYKNLWIRYSYLRSHQSLDWIFGAVAAIRAGTFRKAGGFNREFYVKQGGEDLELGKRMTRSQYRIRLEPAVEVEHLKQHTLRSLLKNDYDRSQGFVRLALKLGQFGTSFRRGFVNIYPGFAYSVPLAWLIFLTGLSGLWRTEYWWGTLASTALYTVINVPFLAYYSRQRPMTELPAIIGIMFLDHLVCAAGSVRGILSFLFSPRALR